MVKKRIFFMEYDNDFGVIKRYIASIFYDDVEIFNELCFSYDEAVLCLNKR